MKNYSSELLRIGKITGMYYKVANRKSSNIVIYGIGAPLPPDNGTLQDASHILDFDVDLFVPDYIGYGRSEGKFTPMSCVNTFLHLYEDIKKGCAGKNHYKGTSLSLKYKNIYFIGRSWGGIYVLLLPRFNKEITNICAIFPLVDWKSQGINKDQEETINGFVSAMTDDGYKYLYRGILNPIWKKHFTGEDKLAPVDNIKYLKNAKIFIGHGKKDINIHYRKSEAYYKKIIQLFPDRKAQFNLKLYPYDHSKKTSNKSIVDYFRWMKIPKLT